MFSSTVCKTHSGRAKGQLQDQFRAQQEGSESSWHRVMKLESGTERHDSRNSFGTRLIVRFRLSKGKMAAAHGESLIHTTPELILPQNSTFQGFLTAYLLWVLFIDVSLCFR